MKDFKLTTFNAVSETAHEKATFKGSLKKRRALVPVSGWWEWTAGETPKGPKTRWSFTPAEGGIITLGGLWERAHMADAPVESFTIMTQASGGHLADYHHRAPVVIHAENRERWLDHDADPADMLAIHRPDDIIVRRAAPSETGESVAYA